MVWYLIEKPIGFGKGQLKCGMVVLAIFWVILMEKDRHKFEDKRLDLSSLWKPKKIKL